MSDQVGDFFELLKCVGWVVQDHNLEDVAEMALNRVTLAGQRVLHDCFKVAEMQVTLRKALGLEG